MYNILICDDEPDIRAALRIYLTGEGYEVTECATGEEAVKAVSEGTVHLALLDVMMPKMDGIAATVKLRQMSNLPIILLTAKSEDADKVLGLTVGADDYVTKPFNPMEVLARVKSQLRRYTRLGSMEKSENRLCVGGIALDDGSKEVTRDGEPVSLTPIEFSILKLMLENPNHVLSSREIYRRVWGDTAVNEENTVAVHIRHLREKLEINPAEPRYITVVWGHGYKLQGDYT